MDAQRLKEMQANLEAQLKAKKEENHEDRASRLEISVDLVKYLEKLESRIETLEKELDKLQSQRD